MMNGLNIYQIKKLFRKIVLAAVLICSLTSLLSAQNVGLVLSGGGAKGAYEVGVWKALTDVGITDRISVISGTSVGALNAGLFVCTPVKEAEKLWRNEVGIDTFLMPDTDTVEALLEVVIKDILSGAAKANLRYANEEDNSELLKKVKKTASVVGNSTSNLVKSLGKELLEYSQADKHNEGLFKRDSLEEILDRYITLEKIKASPYKVYATTIRKRMLKRKALANAFLDYDSSHSLLLNEQRSSLIVKQIMLASSALPLVYSSQPISAGLVENGKVIREQFEYIDGGFTEIGGQNTPYKPILRENVDIIVVVYLKSEEELCTMTDHKSEIKEKPVLISKEMLNGKKLIEIIPSKNLGNLLSGTVNFSPDKINALINLGYNDTMKMFLDGQFSDIFM